MVLVGRNNMKLEDIIDTLNQYITDLRKQQEINEKGYFTILRTSLTPSSFTKAIKTFNITLYYSTNKINTVIKECSLTDKITTDPQELKLQISLEQLMVEYIFKLLQDKEHFNKFLHNEI